jgi:hypothetical protein
MGSIIPKSAALYPGRSFAESKFRSLRAPLFVVSLFPSQYFKEVPPIFLSLTVLLIREKTYHFKPCWLSRVVTFFAGGEIHAEEHHPVSRFLFRQ